MSFDLDHEPGKLLHGSQQFIQYGFGIGEYLVPGPYKVDIVQNDLISRPGAAVYFLFQRCGRRKIL